MGLKHGKEGAEEESTWEYCEEEGFEGGGKKGRYCWRSHLRGGGGGLGF